MPMNPNIIIAWDPEGAATIVATAEEAEVVLRGLDERLRQQGGAPVLAVVEREGETTSLGIGLGGQASMLSWLNNAEPFEDMVSEGSSQNSDTYAQFMYAGVESEYPGSVLIRLEDSLSAARRYIESGQRPTGVRWQEI